MSRPLSRSTHVTSGFQLYWHDHALIERELARVEGPPEPKRLATILGRAQSLKPLTIADAATLLRTIVEPSAFEEVIAAADEVRRALFGSSVKLYVPVYISNYCANNCSYCAFRRNNRALARRLLSVDEFTAEIKHVVDLGHRHVEVVLGYDPRITKGSVLADYIRPLKLELDARGGGTIIIMTEPMDSADYAELREAGATEVYCWQETYHPATYRSVHAENTSKGDFPWRYQVFDRVLQAGIKRVGLGYLFGLYRWDYDELSLLRHALWIREAYGLEPYAFGVPRLKKADGAPLQVSMYPVSDDQYRLSVAVRRLMFPYSHTYMNSRENLDFLVELLRSGGTEINSEASTVPGGYTQNVNGNRQFFHYSYDNGSVRNTLRSAGLEATFEEVTPEGMW